MSNFVNPPYGRQLGTWVQKAFWEFRRNRKSVLLIPARPDTAYWHDYIFPFATEIRFLRGRLKFDDIKTNAPFPSAVIVYK